MALNAIAILFTDRREVRWLNTSAARLEHSRHDLGGACLGKPHDKFQLGRGRDRAKFVTNMFHQLPSQFLARALTNLEGHKRFDGLSLNWIRLANHPCFASPVMAPHRPFTSTSPHPISS